MSAGGQALFLDRDGTLVEHVPYLHEPGAVQLLPGTREALCGALEAGFRLFLFTNQSGVGRGMFTLDAVEACNRRMLELLDLPPPGFTDICVAPELPGTPGGYRKPNPRFILESIQRHRLDPELCWMIGDSECDVQAGLRAGIRTLRVAPGRSLSSLVRGVLQGREPHS